LDKAQKEGELDQEQRARLNGAKRTRLNGAEGTRFNGARRTRLNGTGEQDSTKRREQDSTERREQDSTEHGEQAQRGAEKGGGFGEEILDKEEATRRAQPKGLATSAARIGEGQRPSRRRIDGTMDRNELNDGSIDAGTDGLMD